MLRLLVEDFAYIAQKGHYYQEILNSWQEIGPLHSIQGPG